MTINLQEHMANKRKEQEIAAFNAIGVAVDGMPVGGVLNVMAAFVRTILGDMSGSERMASAMLFYKIIAGDPVPDEKDTIQ